MHQVFEYFLYGPKNGLEETYWDFSNISCLKVQIISDTTNHPSGDHPEGVKTKILKVTNYIDLD